MSAQKYVAESLESLPEIASDILNKMPDQRIFALKGSMGAGKTTLIKELCKVLGTTEVVSSPTFALVNEYTDRNDDPVYHFDFYRIKKVDEVYDIGYEEYFFSGFYCFIEWPELIEGLLPVEHVEISLEVGANEERTIAARSVSLI